MTIFGVVGGPLLGLFSLGMMTTKANQRGALLGFCTSLALLFWIGFGRPKPPVIPLQTYANSTACQFKINATETVNDTKNVDHDDEYFYPYCISYAWYAMIGTFLTFLIGYVSSLVIRDDKDGTKHIHPDLFISPIRKQLLQKNQNFDDINEKTDNIVRNLELLPVIDVEVPDTK